MTSWRPLMGTPRSLSFCARQLGRFSGVCWPRLVVAGCISAPFGWIRAFVGRGMEPDSWMRPKTRHDDVDATVRTWTRSAFKLGRSMSGVGYEVFGTLDEYPIGHQHFFMRKALGPIPPVLDDEQSN